MPLTDEDIVRDLLHRYTEDVQPDGSVAAQVALRQRRREIRRRAGSAIAAGAALGVAAGVIAVVQPKGNGPAVATGTPTAAPKGSAPEGAAPHGATAPAITLTAGQRVLYQLSAAAAKQQATSGRYVTLYEKEDGNLDANVIDTQTGTDYGYQKGYDGAPSGVGAPDKNFSPTAAEFAAMPLDPSALRQSLIAYYDAQAAAQAPKWPKGSPAARVTPRPTPADDIVFSQAMSFLWNPSTPPQLRAALFRVLAGMPGVRVDASARDMLGRPAVKISWTASDTTVYTVYENPANGTVLEQTYQWPASMDLAPGYDLMLRVTRTNTIPPDPYTS
jgi:hypothetical protein